ncbi:hypothetical protein ISU07_20460 [Nocardioides islandensis]|uniref:Big-1 domain-containing protein n=1 Tax=Nocardioides islandensis TaxID=433663 RepID=A0A930YJY8_9ACTN|nr:Ig-like domain-containing protein [Nocardioides islandensis]MBF4765509.1 hypothetical protein [Nocardioides islandensis]
MVTAPPATAVADAPWTASVFAGGGSTSVVSTGAATPASMTYNSDGSTSASWDFTTKATAASAAGPIKVPYTWQGLHAWFQVTTRLDMIVNGQVVKNLLTDGPAICCTSPSNGFIYGGTATFNDGTTVDLGAGDTYGFRMSGSHNDINRLLRGTLTLTTRPYLDATVGTDNRDWSGAKTLPTDEVNRSLNEAGEARWFKFPVVPGEDVTVELSGLTKDYDVALYGDIGAAYNALSGEGAAASSGTSSTALGDTQVPGYPKTVSTIPTAQTTQKFAPRIYAPRIYAPRIYAPRIYAPRIYAPRIYAPRIYAPDAYVPELVSDSSFQDAYSAAQNQTLLAVSTNVSTTDEVINAASGNTNGYFYIRVQGHTDQDFAASTPFTITAEASGSGCTSLDDKGGLQLIPNGLNPGANPTTLVVTDSSRTNYATNDLGERISTPQALLDKLGTLAGNQNGLVVDLKNSPRVQALWGQTINQSDCPYAVNLVAAAVDEIIETLQGAGTKYVVLAGGDDVVPFFRYPDVSGLGQESQFDPPMRPGTASDGSLKRDQVLSQDAYGSQTDVTIAGVSLPVPERSVGRLVKTDLEIESTIDNFVTDGGNLITPTSSLVTGYDFLTDAANAVDEQFTQALGPAAPAGAADRLISDNNAPNAPDYQWDADALEAKLLGGSHHDVVFLAGHFSANDAEAADFHTALDASALAPDGQYPDHLKNTLVLSAGCHSGYNIVDKDGVVPTQTDPGTNTFDWTQRMAQQHALLIGGTGYQYGDSDFLEYSERLYLEISKRLHDTTGGPIAIGNALVLAKQDYLSGLTNVTGIDQKALLQATLYGLPMTGFDAPGRTSLAPEDGGVNPDDTTREPGATLGLRVADRLYNTESPKPRHHKTLADGTGGTVDLTWIEGKDGVVVQPGAPAIPKQIEDVSVDGATLRGVGFRSGSYDDTTGLFPLTGAPAIEGPTPNSTFESDFFFPQSLTTANYFGTLGASGRTSLILTPAQYRTDAGADIDLPTDTERAYSDMGVRLFYTGSDDAASQAASPAIANVLGTYSGTDVSFSAQVTGDPLAGVQQVWVTFTDGPDGPDGEGHGTWESFDLTQDPNDSTRWIGTTSLNGRSPADFRFLVQAANGAGAVSLDTAAGDGYRIGTTTAADAAFVALQTGDANSPYGVRAVVTDGGGNKLADRTVHLTVSAGGQDAYDYYDVTDTNGRVSLRVPTGQSIPSGVITVTATVLGASGQVVDTDTLVLDTAKLTLTNGDPAAGNPLGFSVRATDLSDTAVAGRTVRFTVTRNGTELYSRDVTTDEDGVAVAPLKSGVTTAPAGEIRIVARLLDVSGENVQDTVSATKTIADAPVTLSAVTPAYAVTRAGRTYTLGTPLSVKVSDPYGDVPFYTVTFGFPTGPGVATATFKTSPTASPASSVNATTTASGVATVPATTIVTAGTLVGSFNLTITATGDSSTIPFAAQYLLSPYGAPVDGATVDTSTGATVPLKTTAVLADDTQLSDALSAQLVPTRVQLRYREQGTSLWKLSTIPIVYDSKKHFFQVDLKPSSLSMSKGKKYDVEFRVLALAPKPSGDELQLNFDLGRRRVVINVTK